MATDNQNEWLSRVLGIDVGAVFDTAFLTERLTAIVTDVKLYNAVALSPRVKEAAAAVKARRADAEALIAALEEDVATAGADFRRADARQEIGRSAMGKAGVVAFAKMRLRWQEARASYSDAVANVSSGLRALLETDEFQEDPRSYDADTPALIDALAAQLPPLDDIADAIDDALDARYAPDERADHLTTAAGAIRAYRARLASFDDLREFESTAAGRYPSISLIETSLADLTGALEGALAGLERDRKAENAA